MTRPACSAVHGTIQILHRPRLSSAAWAALTAWGWEEEQGVKRRWKQRWAAGEKGKANTPKGQED
jgi:hypothetical protein